MTPNTVDISTGFVTSVFNPHNYMMTAAQLHNVKWESET